MSVLDKFLNVMKLNDDEDFDGEGYLDEPSDEDFNDEPRVGKRLIRSRDADDDFEDSSRRDRGSVSADPDDEPAPVRSRSSNVRTRPSAPAQKIAPMRPRRRGESSMEVCVIRPHSMEDAREITETLLANCTVVLNVEGLELEIAQRIIDFASGSCYAIDGNLQKISSYIFIITPSTVDISGDFQEILSGAFDVPFEKKGY